MNTSRTEIYRKRKEKRGRHPFMPDRSRRYCAPLGLTRPMVYVWGPSGWFSPVWSMRPNVILMTVSKIGVENPPGPESGSLLRGRTMGGSSSDLSASSLPPSRTFTTLPYFSSFVTSVKNPYNSITMTSNSYNASLSRSSGHRST